MIHPSPAKIAHESVQARFHAMDIHIMAKSRSGADARDARLIGIDFPRVKIKNGGKPVDMIDSTKHPAREAIGHQPEIAAAACRPVAVQES